MRDLRELDVAASRTSKGRLPADDLLVANFEKRFDVKLPEELRRFFKEIPGGYPQLSVFREGGDVWEVNNFFGLLRGEPAGSLSGLMSELAHVLQPGEVPFGKEAGGNLFIVDTRKTPSPVSVILFDEGLRRQPLTRSFGEFIDRLEDVPDEEL